MRGWGGFDFGGWGEGGRYLRKRTFWFFWGVFWGGRVGLVFFYVGDFVVGVM